MGLINDLQDIRKELEAKDKEIGRLNKENTILRQNSQYLVKQKDELEEENKLLQDMDKILRKENTNLKLRINKAIEYIETHQLNFKKGTTTFGSERLSMEERKLLDILKGVDKE